MNDRSTDVNSRKKGFGYLLLIGICLSQTVTTADVYAANGKATVGFYEVEKEEQKCQNLPLTGEKQSTGSAVKTGISILMVTIGMFAYRNLTYEERI